MQNGAQTHWLTHVVFKSSDDQSHTGDNTFCVQMCINTKGVYRNGNTKLVNVTHVVLKSRDDYLMCQNRN